MSKVKITLSQVPISHIATEIPKDILGDIVLAVLSLFPFLKFILVICTILS